jgi:hypothetical protein
MILVRGDAGQPHASKAALNVIVSATACLPLSLFYKFILLIHKK